MKDPYKQHGYVSFLRLKKLPVSKKLLKQISEMYSDSKYHLSCQNGGHWYYWKDRDVGKRVIASEFLIPPSLDKESLKDIVLKMSQVDKRVNTLQFFVPTGVKIYHDLLRRGAKNSGSHLYALVQDGLDYLNGFEYDSTIKVARMTKKDIEEVVELEYRAHRRSDSSRVRHLKKSNIWWLYNYLLKNKKREVIVLKDDRKIIGVIAFVVNNFGAGFILTIAVHVEHLGRGVSKMLYYEAFKRLKESKVKVYSGVSSTSEVLYLGRKMGRKSMFSYLEVDKRDFF